MYTVYANNGMIITMIFLEPVFQYFIYSSPIFFYNKCAAFVVVLLLFCFLFFLLRFVGREEGQVWRFFSISALVFRVLNSYDCKL